MNKVFLPIKNNQSQSYFHIDNTKAPFISILTEIHTTKIFIEHIKSNAEIEARAFLSGNYKSGINIEILQKFFNDKFTYKLLNKVPFVQKNQERTVAFLILDDYMKYKGVINFYMKNEPDKFSKWKIYKIIKERTI